MMQIRPKSGDGPAYAPNRDLSHNFRYAARKAVYLLEGTELPGYATPEGVTAAAEMLAEYINKVHEPESKSVEAAMDAAGWNQCHAASRDLVMARLGETFLVAYFQFYRDAYTGRDYPSDLAELFEDVAKLKSKLVTPAIDQAILAAVSNGQSYSGSELLEFVTKHVQNPVTSLELNTSVWRLVNANQVEMTADLKVRGHDARPAPSGSSTPHGS